MPDKYILPVRFGQVTEKGKPVPHVMQWGMRGACIAMALALAVAVPLVALQPVEYQYILGSSVDASGDYVVDIGGTFRIGDWDQERAYTVTIDSETMRVSDIVPVKENSYGYVAELSLFIGKTRHEIAIMSGGDLSTDSETSATVTNTALRGMLIECFDYIKNEMEGGNNG